MWGLSILSILSVVDSNQRITVYKILWLLRILENQFLQNLENLENHYNPWLVKWCKNWPKYQKVKSKKDSVCFVRPTSCRTSKSSWESAIVFQLKESKNESHDLNWKHLLIQQLRLPNNVLKVCVQKLLTWILCMVLMSMPHHSVFCPTLMVSILKVHSCAGYLLMIHEWLKAVQRQLILMGLRWKCFVREAIRHCLVMQCKMFH